MHVLWPKPKSVRPISTTRSVRDEFGGDLTLNFQIETNLREVFAGQDDFNHGKNHGKAMCYESELRNSTKDQVHTLIRRWTCYGGNGGADCRSLAARRQFGDPRRQSRIRAGWEVLKEFPKSHPWVFISRPCRCDRVEQLGGTEIHNCKQLLKLGVTEKFKSVAPRSKT